MVTLARRPLARPPREVLRVVRAGFITPRRVGSGFSVTFGACWRYLDEVRLDLVEVRAARREPFVPAE